MPINGKINVAPFLGGIVTEASAISNSFNTCADELNCTIWPKAVKGRRYGMNIEREGVWTDAEESTVYSDYLWKNVNKSDRDFIIKQVGKTLTFYNADSKPFSTNQIAGTIDLSSYITDESNFYNFPLKCSSGGGYVICVSRYMEPIKITFSDATNTFTATQVYLKYRDITGLEDGLAIDEMPTSLEPEHEYNLHNQGWTYSTINSFHNSQGSYPSNNLQWFVGKDSSKVYQTDLLLKTYFGTSQAPKGHYILDYFKKDRAIQSGITGVASKTCSFYQANVWTDDRTYEYNPIWTSSATNTAAYGTITLCILKISENTTAVGKRAWGQYVGKMIAYVYGKNKDGTWTLLQTQTIRHQSSSSTDPTFITFNLASNTTYYYGYKVTVETKWGETGKGTYGHSHASTAKLNWTASFSMAEDGDPFGLESQSARVTDIAYMSGKYFYLCNDTVLFSQTVGEDNANYEKCYQDADPTSEEISDLVDTDGGYIQFATLGIGKALKVFNKGVLVFGRDSVWGIISASAGRFTATSYDIAQLSSAGLVGNQAVVSTSDSVYYWSPLGIFRIGVNYQTSDTLVAENISMGRIQTLYNAIPDFSKSLCKAAFDYTNNRIYWYYPTNPGEYYNLDGCLVYDLNNDAFMQYKVSNDGKVVSVFETANSYPIEPTQYVKANKEVVYSNGVPVTATEETTEYTRYVAIQHGIINSKNQTSFGDYNNRDFLDWDTKSFDSYIVSNPIIATGEYTATGNMVATTNVVKQTPMIETIFERTEVGALVGKNNYISPSGAYIRVRWGYSMDENSNRWDMKQNGYLPQKDFMHTDAVVSKVHVKGRGRAFQIEIRNDGDKDFRLIGLNLKTRGV